jgi:hypothetical protein
MVLSLPRFEVEPNIARSPVKLTGDVDVPAVLEPVLDPPVATTYISLAPACVSMQNSAMKSNCIFRVRLKFLIVFDN